MSPVEQSRTIEITKCCLYQSRHKDHYLSLIVCRLLQSRHKDHYLSLIVLQSRHTGDSISVKLCMFQVQHNRHNHVYHYLSPQQAKGVAEHTQESLSFTLCMSPVEQSRIIRITKCCLYRRVDMRIAITYVEYYPSSCVCYLCSTAHILNYFSNFMSQVTDIGLTILYPTYNICVTEKSQVLLLVTICMQPVQQNKPIGSHSVILCMWPLQQNIPIGSLSVHVSVSLCSHQCSRTVVYYHYLYMYLSGAQLP